MGRNLIKEFNMVDTTIRKLFKKFIDPKKYVSDFVKKQRALDARANAKPIVLWDSLTKGTYVRKKHGALI
jgi:hypothetical protein